jgi:hypothetical protein
LTNANIQATPLCNLHLFIYTDWTEEHLVQSRMPSIVAIIVKKMTLAGTEHHKRISWKPSDTKMGATGSHFLS